MPRNYWLKMVGAQRAALEDRWLEARPELLRGVRSPRKPTGIRSDDYLVFYSAGTQKLFAIARSTEDGETSIMESGPGQKDWPYLLHIQVLLAIPQLSLAPHWSVLNMNPTAVQQKSYVAMTDEQYRLAYDAIGGRWTP
jgi:hypothetical protein